MGFSGEVLVAGGGLIGSSIAWRLAQRGARVLLADAGNLGGEASSAGAGMLSPGGEFEEPSTWLDRGFESLRLYPEFVRELVGEAGVSVDFQICGCLVIGARKAAPGVRTESRAEGLYYPDDGIVDPAQLLLALRRACEMRGVRVLPQRLERIEARDYASVVIAAGAWSSDIQVLHNGPVVLPAVVPVKGHLIGFQLEPGLLGPVRRHGETYVLQRSKGFLVAGSNEEERGFDARVDPELCQDIHRRAALLFPPLQGATPVKRWIGFRPRSVEGHAPHLGRVPGTNVWLAYGHYRNGILLTPVTALQIADGICA